MHRFINDVLTNSNILRSDRLAETNRIELVALVDELGSLEGRGLSLTYWTDLTGDWAERTVSLRSSGGHEVGCRSNALIDCLESKPTRGARVSLILKACCELFEILLKLVILILVVGEALIIRLVALVTILER